MGQGTSLAHQMRYAKLREIFTNSPHFRLDEAGEPTVPVSEVCALLTVFFCHYPLKMQDPTCLEILQRSPSEDSRIDAEQTLVFLGRAGVVWISNVYVSTFFWGEDRDKLIVDIRRYQWRYVCGRTKL